MSAAQKPNVSQIGLSELSPRGNLLHLYVTPPQHQSVLLAQFLRGPRGPLLEQQAYGPLGLLQIQGVDFLSAQVEHLVEGIPVGEGSGAVGPEVEPAAEHSGRLPQSLDELEGGVTLRHG